MGEVRGYIVAHILILSQRFRAIPIRLIHRKEQTMNDIKVPPFTDEQKKVIEVTERIANGKLICDVDDDIDVLTNDKWRRTCSTEEFAEWITELSELCTIRHQCELCDGWCDEKRVMEWLKEKHHANEFM